VRALVLFLALAACVTPTSANQGIYAAYASYSIALKAAADYAEGPTAEPRIVHTLNTVNRRTETRQAVTYGKAYVLCQGNSEAVVVGVDCAFFDFKASTAQAYAITLRSVATALLVRN
jgi:hypothetical protein